MVTKWYQQAEHDDHNQHLKFDISEKGTLVLITLYADYENHNIQSFHHTAWLAGPIAIKKNIYKNTDKNI